MATIRLNEYSTNAEELILARNKELNQKMRDERREQILSNALGLFATKGLAATKISDISLTSGISQGLFYHYFRSKEEIFTELISNAFEKLNSACLELESSSITPREKIFMAIAGLIKGLEENEDAARYHLLIAQATVSDAIPEEAKAIISTQNMVPYEVMTRIIIEGQKDGSIKQYDAKELALVFWTSINGLAIYKAVHGEKFKKPDSNILASMFF